MKVQLSRLEMFEKIERLKRDLADSAWEHVNLSHSFIKLKTRHDAYKDFIQSNALEATIGMASGADGNLISMDLIVSTLRAEFKKIDEQLLKED